MRGPGENPGPSNVFGIVKVLKKGSGQKDWAKECKCTGAGNDGGGCGAKLLVEKGDLFQTYASYMGRDEEWFVTFKCPECKVLTDLKDTPFQGRDLPKYKKRDNGEK